MTNFSEKVFLVVKKIPRGKVLTYAEVAHLAGKPKAARAVGNILNKNLQLITIPCHRVVRGDGRVGGYIKGEKEKTKILEKEGIRIRRGRIL